MRLSLATLTANTEIRSGVHLIEMYAPQVAQSVQPGQFCMIRCCDPLATDPLLRRPFFLHSTQSNRQSCTLLIHVRGRGTTWLARQQEGATLDILSPLGHGWTIPPTARNLLLVNEGANIAPLTLLAQYAVEQECAVTLVSSSRSSNEVYSPALLPPEVEYHIITSDGSIGERGDIVTVLGNYLPWADAMFCSVSHETYAVLYNRYERLRLEVPGGYKGSSPGQGLATAPTYRARSYTSPAKGTFTVQGVILRPLVCGSGVCLTCTIETHSGPKLLCRDGPVFNLREIM